MIYYLVGMMGSGKTTIAEILEKKLNLKALDTDNLIENEYKMSIKDIFEKYSEATFREYETNVLKKVSLFEFDNNKSLIIATGGGVILKKENIDIMKKTGKIIYLKVEPEVLFKRLSASEEVKKRPLLSGQSISLDKISHMLQKRALFYEKYANYIIQETCIDKVSLELETIITSK